LLKEDLSELLETNSAGRASWTGRKSLDRTERPCHCTPPDEGGEMLSKCANPSCSTPLVYLREGKIFMMEQSHSPQMRPESPVLVKPNSRVEHFWLCGPCSAEMTLTYDSEQGIRLVPKEPKIKRAAAS
jgi:hypothetical protein